MNYHAIFLCIAIATTLSNQIFCSENLENPQYELLDTTKRYIIPKYFFQFIEKGFSVEDVKNDDPKIWELTYQTYGAKIPTYDLHNNKFLGNKEVWLQLEDWNHVKDILDENINSDTKFLIRILPSHTENNASDHDSDDDQLELRFANAEQYATINNNIKTAQRKSQQTIFENIWESFFGYQQSKK